MLAVFTKLKFSHNLLAQIFNRYDKNISSSDSSYKTPILAYGPSQIIVALMSGYGRFALTRVQRPHI